MKSQWVTLNQEKSLSEGRGRVSLQCWSRRKEKIGTYVHVHWQYKPDSVGHLLELNDNQNLSFSCFLVLLTEVENWKWDTSGTSIDTNTCESAGYTFITLNFSWLSSPLLWGYLSLSLYQQIPFLPSLITLRLIWRYCQSFSFLPPFPTQKVPSDG